MAWFSASLEDDMWREACLFKSDQEYREELLKTKATKYIKEPILNSLNTCDGFETIYSLGGGEVGIQTEKRYIMLLDDLFELEVKGQFQPKVVTSIPPPRLFPPLFLQLDRKVNHL